MAVDAIAKLPSLTVLRILPQNNLKRRHYLSCHPIASSSRHWRHSYVRDMFLRFLKRHKFVVEKEVLYCHGALNSNPIPPNLTGVDTIATQLDSQDTLYDSQVDGNGIRLLNSVGEGDISNPLDSQFSQMDSQVDRDDVSVAVIRISQ